MIKRILDIIYPGRCVLCLQTHRPQITPELNLCTACQTDLLQVTTACYQCGIPLEDSKPGQICGQCLQKKPAFDRVISIYHYRDPLVWLIQQMKFHNKPTIAHLLGRLMANHLEHLISLKDFQKPEVIMPVPLHYKRQHKRGFNQAEEFAKIISATIGCPIDTQSIERNISSQQQSGLDARQRRKNVKGIFRIKNQKQLNYEHVVLIDDVMSTGSTANEIARTLKRAGVDRVDIWILARASKH